MPATPTPIGQDRLFGWSEPGAPLPRARVRGFAIHLSAPTDLEAGQPPAFASPDPYRLDIHHEWRLFIDPSYRGLNDLTSQVRIGHQLSWLDTQHISKVIQ